MEPFSTCICKTSIPSSYPYCLQNKNCLEFIIERVRYLFDDEVPKGEIEKFVRQLPITLNKRLIKKEPIILSELDPDLQQKILSSSLVPIDFLLPNIVLDYPNNLQQLQKNEKMISLGKEIRKRNFSTTLIEKLDRLAFYFAIFLYESRTHPIWRAVIDSVIKAPFTPEKLLQYLDTLYRRNASEYMKFYATLSQNSSLTRIIYLIEAMSSQKESSSATDSQEKTEEEDIMSLPKLNHYAHHWFPGIVLASIKHPDVYKTTLEKVYDELYRWEELYQSLDPFTQYEFYQSQPENPQKINPLYLDILQALLTSTKIPSKLLAKEIHNTNLTIRKTIVLSATVTSTILNQLQNDQDEVIRKIAQYKLVLLKKEKEILKNVPAGDDTDDDKTKPIISPNHLKNVFKEYPDSQYY